MGVRSSVQVNMQEKNGLASYFWKKMFPSVLPTIAGVSYKINLTGAFKSK